MLLKVENSIPKKVKKDLEDFNPQKILISVGNIVVSDIKKNIHEGGRPKRFKPLSEFTQQFVRKGEPLLDTGRLPNSIFFKKSSNVAGIVSTNFKWDYVQHFGAKIQVTPKMRGYFAWRWGVHLKKSTTHIIIPARPFFNVSKEGKRELKAFRPKK